MFNWIRLFLLHFDTLILGGGIFWLLITIGTGFGPYWDSWLFYNRAMPWSYWLASWWNGQPAPSLLNWQIFFPDASRHPPLMEIGGGFCHALFKNSFGELGSCRLFVEFFTSLSLAVMYGFLKTRLGRIGGLFGVCLFLGSPRFLVHGVRFGIDGLIAALYGMAVIAFLGWGRRAGNLMWIFILVVLSFLTKIQGFYLVVVLIFWILLLNLERTRKGQIFFNPQAGTDLASGLLLAGLAAGLAIFLWPPLWLNFPEAFNQFIHFTTHHVKIAVLYFGTVYGEGNPPPWHYPWGFCLVALPLWLTLPILIKAVRRLVLAGLSFRQSYAFDSQAGAGFQAPLRRMPSSMLPAQEEGLFWGAMLIPLVISSMPDVPRFDGIRLLLPAMIPWVVLVADEILCWWRWIELRLLKPFHASIRMALFSPMLLLVLLPSIRIYPYNLCYYSPLIGGTSGAQRAGFDLDYLGVSMHLLNPALSRVAHAGDILLLLGGNSPVYHAGPEGWTPVPEGIRAMRFFIDPNLLSEKNNIFVIIGSRYSDFNQQVETILREAPIIQTVTCKGERLFSLHRLDKALIRRLLD